MSAGVLWWQRWARQVLPRRTARTCCWCHGGGWHAVSAMAPELLQWARAQAVEPNDMRMFVVARAAAAARTTTWETEALAALFDTDDAFQPGRNARYINGQHRFQATLETGVRRIVVLRHVSAA
ncbi:hypothetical protein [Streptomyces sp. NBC_01768]|uniref:hypothetical protein n=1 Tax=Streptomyces sp. NBC_01768 TaxID=2975938 RepID=UPI002DDB28E3|nr:hypothetical protein [Streptomyces sp. NBC_01768]WSC32118.1 hypothetical protein OG902_38565 [Streptomyces sp. NBC_01768]